MLNSVERPAFICDTASFRFVTDCIHENNFALSDFQSNCVINRNALGVIESVDYYGFCNNLIKRIYYKNDKVCRINHYQCDKLYCSEDYENDVTTKKIYYERDGKVHHSYNYEYNSKGLITKLSKNLIKKEVTALYDYDDLNRIMRRTILIDKNKLLSQRYIYDILNRVIAYQDENQYIKVSKMGRNQELISYEITDKMKNVIEVTNEFNAGVYSRTIVNTNGYASIIENKCYVDNVMLKAPNTTEDDLDLIISNIFRSNNASEAVRRHQDSERKSQNLICENIESKVLPISMRKRVLYNMALQNS